LVAKAVSSTKVVKVAAIIEVSTSKVSSSKIVAAKVTTFIENNKLLDIFIPRRE